MKKSEEKYLKSVLEALPEESDMKFKYGINHNIRNLKVASEAMEKTEKQAREILKDYDAEFEKERNQLITKLGTDTPNGGKEIKPDSENWDKWLKGIKKLQTDLEKKYSKEIESYEEKMKEMMPLYEEESEFKPYKISIDICPQIGRKVLGYLMEVGIIE